MSNAVYVCGYPLPKKQSITSDALRKIFSEFGEIVQIDIPKAPMSGGLEAGFAFIHFMNTESANKATAMNGKEVDGCKLKVSHRRKSRVRAEELEGDFPCGNYPTPWH